MNPPTLLSWMVLAGLLAAAAPARAQVELSGSWAARNHEDALERGAGPYAVDYTGVPLNDDAREKALSYSASQLGMIERQCGLYPPHYIALGPFGLKIWNETDSISGETIAWKIGAWEDRAATTIWMDGRPHPRRTLHTSEAALRPVHGKATRWWPTRRTCVPVSSDATGCPTAIRRP